MKFCFALLCVLCAYALARDEGNKVWKATAMFQGNKVWKATAMFQGNKVQKATGKSLTAIWEHRLEDKKTKRASFFRPTPKIEELPADSLVIAKKRNGTTIMSSCSTGGGIDEIVVGVKRIQAKNGAEFVYLPMDTEVLENCFESYNNTILNAPDLISCCDAAAAGGYNSFRFNGSACKGFKAWLSPMNTQCLEDKKSDPAEGFFVAKKKLSKFTPRAPTFNTSSSSLGLSRIVVEVENITDQCPFSKTLKVTTYSKNESTQLNSVDFDRGYQGSFYLPELCDDNASAAKRTVTVSILDSDGSELVSVKEVLSTNLTGRHLISNDVCMMYRATPLGSLDVAVETCPPAYSVIPLGTGFLPFTDLVRQIIGLKVGVENFWSDASLDGNSWVWDATNSPMDMSLFSSQAVVNDSMFSTAIVNVTDGLLYTVGSGSEYPIVCVDAPYYNFF